MEIFFELSTNIDRHLEAGDENMAGQAELAGRFLSFQVFFQVSHPDLQQNPIKQKYCNNTVNIILVLAENYQNRNKTCISLFYNFI